MDYWLTYWWVFPFALTICIIVCTVGIEGAILFVPFFAVIFPLLSGQQLAPVEAIKIGLFTEIFGFTSSFLGFWRAKLIDYEISRTSIAVGVPAALAGGFATYWVSGALLLWIVTAALPMMAYLIFRSPSEHGTDAPALPAAAFQGALTGPGPVKLLVDAANRTYRYHYRTDPARLLTSIAGGLFEGLVGFGIGAAGITDLFMRRVPVRVAIGTSSMVVAFVALAAAVPHFLKALATDGVPWNILIYTVPAVSIGGQIAPRVTGAIPQHILKASVALLMVALALITGYRTLVLAAPH